MSNADTETERRSLSRLGGLGNLQSNIYQILRDHSPLSFGEVWRSVGTRVEKRKRGKRWLDVEVPTTNSGSVSRALLSLVERGLVRRVARDGARGRLYYVVPADSSRDQGGRHQ